MHVNPISANTAGMTQAVLKSAAASRVEEMKESPAEKQKELAAKSANSSTATTRTPNARALDVRA
jgi:hypothetical protein